MLILLTIFLGILIGVQSSIGSYWGGRVEPALVGLLTMIIGGAIALGILLAGHTRFLPLFLQLTPSMWVSVTVSGIISIVALSGMAYVLPSVGLTLAAVLVILGQVVLTLVLDSSGAVGRQIDLSLSRIVGVVLLLVAVWLINK